MGRWISEKILSRETRFDLTLADIDAGVRDLAERLSRPENIILSRPIGFKDGQVTGLDPGSYDAIVLAVPTGEIERVSKAVVSRAKPGALVLDVASDKTEPLEAMLEVAPPGVSVIGTHPMFGPRVESLVGQTVVVCETPATDPRHLDALTELVEKYGGDAHSLTPEKHDSLMGVVQGLPHFVHLALGETFRQGDLDLRDTLPIQTPPFRSAVSVLGRMVHLSGERQAELYASIQRAPGSATLRKAFIAAAIELDERFDAESPSTSQVAIEEIARSFPPSTIDQLSAQSDEVVQARQAVEVDLQRLKESGEVCGFESLVDKKVTIGLITDFDPTSVTLTGNLVESNGKLAAIYDEESQEVARELGISSLPKEQVLPRSHHRLLRSDEVQSWRAAKLESHPTAITLGVPAIANNHALANYLVELIPEVLEACVGTVFDPGEGGDVRQVTFHLKIIGDRHPNWVKPAVVDFIENIGGSAPRAAPAQHPGPGRGESAASPA